MNTDYVKYDNYISLGYNCEAGFQFRRVLGEDSSSFFNWNITPVKGLLSLLNSDFEGVLERENIHHLENDLFTDSKYNYSVHADFSYPDLNADKMFDEKLRNLHEKTNYFLAKFRSLSEKGRTAFFYKTDELNNIHNFMIETRDSLTKFVPSEQFSLIVAIPAATLVEAYHHENVYFRPLTRFAPAGDAHDGHVSSWDKIFTEFPHRNGLRLAGY